MITLAPQQEEAYDKIMHWWRSGKQAKQRFVLAGYAGTGKTSLARVVEERVEGVLFLAYTGKAVNVLKDKGCRKVSTIHMDFEGQSDEGMRSQCAYEAAEMIDVYSTDGKPQSFALDLGMSLGQINTEFTFQKVDEETFEIETFNVLNKKFSGGGDA